MPVDQTGMDGKIADTLNDILELNEKMVSEFERISRAVGKDGQNRAARIDRIGDPGAGRSASNRSTA